MRYMFFIAIIANCFSVAISENNELKSKRDRIIDVELEEIVITATRSEKQNFFVPQTVNIIDGAEFKDKKLQRTIPESLKEVPGILVQKTAHSQGSPFIRGFTAFRNLFLIDGIRLNNSVFREGPNQYWNTVDSFLISEMEISKGPSSALYGSDSIGGTLQVLTRDAEFSKTKQDLTTELFGRYASAEDSKIGRFDLFGGLSKNTLISLGATTRDFGNLESGGSTGKQPFTGYDEYSFDLKLTYFFDENRKLIFAHQNFKQDDAWRTHKTIHGISFQGTTIGNELKRIQDQERRLSYIQYHSRNISSWIDTLKFNLSYHEQDEERDRERLRNGNIRQDIQGFNVDTIGSWFQLEKITNKGLWSFGLEYYHDEVDSFKREYDLTTGTIRGPFIQGPIGDDSEYDVYGAYLQNDYYFSESFNLITGVRWTRTELSSSKVEDPVSGNEISINDDTNSFIGNIKLSYVPSEKYNYFLGLSQSFRAPNLSDLTSANRHVLCPPLSDFVTPLRQIL